LAQLVVEAGRRTEVVGGRAGGRGGAGVHGVPGFSDTGGDLHRWADDASSGWRWQPASIVAGMARSGGGTAH
jgi:hypothetical protein